MIAAELIQGVEPLGDLRQFAINDLTPEDEDEFFGILEGLRGMAAIVVDTTIASASLGLRYSERARRAGRPSSSRRHGFCHSPCR